MDRNVSLQFKFRSSLGIIGDLRKFWEEPLKGTRIMFCFVCVVRTTFYHGHVWRKMTIKHCLVTKHVDVESSGQTVSTGCQTCLNKQRPNPRNNRYLWIQVKEHDQNVRAGKTCSTKSSNEQNVLRCLIKFIKHNQTLSNNTKQCPKGKMFGHQCLIPFSHQTFPVWPELKRYQL